jgi:signal peptidase I
MSTSQTTWRQTGRILGRVFVCGLFVLGVVLLVAILFFRLSPSYHAYVVTGDSMSPAVAKGDLVIVGPSGGTLTHPLSPGSVVTFRVGGGLVTHRVVAIEGGRLITRGDAVGSNDPWTVDRSDVTGVMMARIPKVGMVPQLLWSAYGLPVFFLIILCGGLLIWLRSPGKPPRTRVRRSAHMPVGHRPS